MNTKIKYLILVIFLSFITFPALAIEHDRFCVVPIQVKDLTGIATTEKYRAISDVTIFDDSEHALFFSYNGHRAMRLVGYELVPIDKKELPHNALSSKDFSIDKNSIIYGTSEFHHHKGIYKMDAVTGRFSRLSKQEEVEIKSDLKPIWSKEKYVGENNDVMLFNRKDGKVYLNGKKVNAVYKSVFSSGKPNLALPVYFPEFKDIFATGYILKPYKYFPLMQKKEYGIFHWNDNTWEHLKAPPSSNYSYITPIGYSKVLDQIIFNGYKKHTHTGKLNYKPSYYNREKKLRSFKNASGISISRVYDLAAFNKVILGTYGNKLYLIKDDHTIIPIQTPESLKNEKVSNIIEMPASNVAIIHSSNGIYIMDENSNISSEPIFSIHGLVNAFVRIPVREEVFISGSKGQFMLIDKKISGKNLCPE